MSRRAAAAGLDAITDLVKDADDLTRQLLCASRAQWWHLLKLPEYQQPHIVQRLIGLADHFRYEDRELAVGLITKAARIVDNLGHSPDINELRFDTWKVAAAITREAGKLQDSEIALARAEDAARFTSDPVRSGALALFYRALFYAEPDVWRPQDAAELLDRVEPIFESWDEVRRQALLRTRAVLLYRSGSFDEARALYEAVLADTHDKSSVEYLDNLHNVMVVRIDGGDVSDEVADAVSHLLAENRARARGVAVARLLWMMGRLLRQRGDYDEAEDVLRTAMAQIGDSDSVIRIGIDYLRTMLESGRDRDALEFAKSLATDAIQLDFREPSRRRSLTAEVLAYAREDAQRGALTADLMGELSRYVDRIHRQRATAFVPPMPLAAM